MHGCSAGHSTDGRVQRLGVSASGIGRAWCRGRPDGFRRGPSHVGSPCLDVSRTKTVFWSVPPASNRRTAQVLGKRGSRRRAADSPDSRGWCRPAVSTLPRRIFACRGRSPAAACGHGSLGIRFGTLDLPRCASSGRSRGSDGEKFSRRRSVYWSVCEADVADTNP